MFLEIILPEHFKTIKQQLVIIMFEILVNFLDVLESKSVYLANERINLKYSSTVYKFKSSFANSQRSQTRSEEYLWELKSIQFFNPVVE